MQRTDGVLGNAPRLAKNYFDVVCPVSPWIGSLGDERIDLGYAIRIVAQNVRYISSSAASTRCNVALSIITVCWIVGSSVVSAAAADTPASIATAARSQIGKTVSYDPSYRALAYPNGDVPMETGVCTDVVVRALRQSLGMDLQKNVHEDMKRNFSKYPQNWGLKKPDRNIDHRRVPNLQVYFKRNGWALPISREAQDYKPGDIVTCTVPPNLAHVMIVSDRTNSSGRPLIIHNIGAGTKEEDRLFEFKITGHYRIKN